MTDVALQPEDKEVALELEGMEIERGPREASLRLVVERFRLYSGEAVALTGPSGCGKSTMLDILAMVLWPDRIERMTVLRPDGETQNATGILRQRRQTEAARLRAAAFGYVLQTGGLLPFLTVRQNVMVADPLGRLDRDELEERIDECAHTLEISERLDQRPGVLSVGERQRAAILRALAKQPSVLLADEPTSNLDPKTSRCTLDLLCKAAEEAGVAVLVVSHDHTLVRESKLPCWKLEPTPIARGGVESHLTDPAASIGTREGTMVS